MLKEYLKASRHNRNRAAHCTLPFFSNLIIAKHRFSKTVMSNKTSCDGGNVLLSTQPNTVATSYMLMTTAHFKCIYGNRKTEIWDYLNSC